MNGGKSGVVGISAIHHHFRPIGIRNVAMLLTIVHVGFEEGNVVSLLSERPNDASIISGGAVPKRGHEARTEKGDAEMAFHGVESERGGAPGARGRSGNEELRW